MNKPSHILSIYDHPEVADRYTVVLGEDFMVEDEGHKCYQYLALSEDPTDPVCGISQFGEVWEDDLYEYEKEFGGQFGISWESLPENIQKHVERIQHKLAEFDCIQLDQS